MYGAMFPLTKSPLYLYCLWVNFLMEKQAGLMSPMSLLPHRILFQPQGRLSYFYFFNQGLHGHIQVWALCCFLSPFTILLTLPRLSSTTISSGRPASSWPDLEFISTDSCSTHPLFPPLSQPFGYFPITVLFLMTHVHTHQPRVPKILRAVTLS